MGNFQVNIANITPEDMAEWLRDYPKDLAFNVERTVSYWEGSIEHGVRVTLWDVALDSVYAMLYMYGQQNPDEQAYGLLELPDSEVIQFRQPPPRVKGFNSLWAAINPQAF